ncbi:efflux RND transporter permease subunit [candidate division CSSED10-310 bacterium]|uniref:Efflux RND transporter permease subunit n=1 Tax=candidate division CSSED10-310 bacterium TaxID=2855610 RepID=A0ABV6Z4N5_UNCC1
MKSRKKIPGPINVDTDIRPGKPEIQIIPKRQVVADFNTTGYAIALTLRATIEGLIAPQYRVQGDEYNIRVKLEEADVEDIEKIKSLVVQTPKGNKRISELADLSFSTAPTMIYRKDKLKMHRVTADIGSRTMGEIVADIKREVEANIDLPPQYKIQAGGDADIQADANKDLGRAFLLAAILTFFLIVAILESWLQGLLIMFTVPLAMIGVLWSLFFAGESMNIFSMMAMVMLIGIVVNNAILILDYANQLRKVGHNKMQAILEACPTKLKAVAMATLASMLGMLPLALGLGSGAELRQGMGIVSIGGLLLSSLLTLFVIPALYVQFVRDKKR